MYHITLAVIGAAGSGLTTFIQTAHGRKDNEAPARSQARRDESRKNHFDFGKIQVDDDLHISLFGTTSKPPGTPQPFWDFICLGKSGFVFLVDSTQSRTFLEIRETIEDIQDFTPVPFIIAATKQDLPNAKSIDTIRFQLGLDDSVLIMPCVATDRNSVRDVLKALLLAIIDDVEN